MASTNDSKPMVGTCLRIPPSISIKSKLSLSALAHPEGLNATNGFHDESLNIMEKQIIPLFSAALFLIFEDVSGFIKPFMDQVTIHLASREMLSVAVLHGRCAGPFQ